MNNKNISTRSGILIIAIIAVFVAVLVWNYAENNQTAQVSDDTISKASIPKSQEPQDTQNATDDWQTFKNDKYGFKIQYPSSFLFDEAVVDGLEYHVDFGTSYKEAFGENGVARKSTGIFEISIYKNVSGIDSLMKKHSASWSGIEHSFVPDGTEKIAGTTAKIVKVCDMGKNCTKVLYIVHSQYIYSISMHNYFTPENETDKQIFDKMIASFDFLRK